MIKKLLYLLVFLITVQCVTAGLFNKHEVEVDDRFQEYYDSLSVIYKRNDIKFDYREISKITHIDSVTPYPGMGKPQGLYDFEKKIIYINPRQMDAFWAGKYDEKITLILAHEMAHSQGKLHSSDYCSIMYPNDRYTLYLLSLSTVEQIVIDIYKIDYPILIQ